MLGSSCDALRKRITRWLSDWLVSMEIRRNKTESERRNEHARFRICIYEITHTCVRFVYDPFQGKYGSLFDIVQTASVNTLFTKLFSSIWRRLIFHGRRGKNTLATDCSSGITKYCIIQMGCCVCCPKRVIKIMWKLKKKTLYFHSILKQ